ncbi:hypothetical protein [Massilia sp. YIM B02443]|uniref:hypothetical protein n=1 Tax=Massilia sp. YIM B02443 TaxID=3050127 RepID=UPI0025B69DB5|nr:hypothetical protein [Massilia sp. YIM B02443]MDN4038683.1 hypothetical protein [Massilia sp. YIM B02443]
MSQPTASPELPDLDHLEALARAATPGPWAYQEDSDAYTHIVRPVASPGWIIASATQTSKPEGEANGRWIAAANPAAVLALIALALRAKPEGEARPTDDNLWDETLRDRDTYHEWADKLAEAISKHFDAYIGEHSNTNCPWHEALEAIESAPPASKPEGEASQATALNGRITGAHACFSEAMPPGSLTSIGHAHVYKALQAAIAHYVAHQPAAQHAESGARCDTCGGSGQYSYGNSGSAEDGNAPVMEPCPECGHAESGAHHLTPENVGAVIKDLREIEDGSTAFPVEHRDWRTQAGVLVRIIESLAAQSQGAQAVDDEVPPLTMAVYGTRTNLELEKQRRAALAAKAEAPAAQQAAAPGAPKIREHRPLCHQCNGRGLIGLLTSLRCNACSGTGRVAAPSAPGTPEAPAEIEKALRELMSIVRIHSDATDENFAWAEMQYAEEVLRAAQLDGGQGEGEKA